MPMYLLFSAFQQDTPVVYRGSWKSEDILRWLIRHTGIYLSLPGSIDLFDKLVVDFCKADNKETKHKLLSTLKELLVDRYASCNYAQYYVHVSEKILIYGENFLKQEENRLKILTDSKISDNQKLIFKRKLNILAYFINLFEKNKRKARNEL